MLLRVALALKVIWAGVNWLVAPSNGVLSSGLAAAAFLLGLFLMLGFLTPITGVVAALGNAAVIGWLWTSQGAFQPAIPSVDALVISVAVVLLGPGAISLDAQIFGRREIIIPPRASPSSE